MDFFSQRNEYDLSQKLRSLSRDDKMRISLRMPMVLTLDERRRPRRTTLPLIITTSTLLLLHPTPHSSRRHPCILLPPLSGTKCVVYFQGNWNISKLPFLLNLIHEDKLTLPLHSRRINKKSKIVLLNN